MILAIDIGNTDSKLAWFDGPEVTRKRRVRTAALVEFLGAMDPKPIRRTGIASVVPDVCRPVEEWITQHWGRAPFLVAHDIELPFEMAYLTPKTLGNDRLAAALGAWYTHRVEGRPVMAIDGGTAVTVELISADGVYLGGTIAPGPDLLNRALQTGTAQLPRVDQTAPKSVVGQSTTEAIRSGIMYGFVDAVAGVLRRMEAEVEGRPTVVATGGWAPMLADHIERIEVVDPELVLRGVISAMQLNPA